VGEDAAVSRWLPGNIITGFSERRGRSSVPERHSAAHALCSKVQMAAVRDGFVKVGVVMTEGEVWSVVEIVNWKTS